MLDSHPSLAIPDESHFIVDLHRRWLGLRGSPAATLERVLSSERFLRWGLDADAVRSLADQTQPRSYGEVMRTVFAAYAAARGKPRWGDKSPPYTIHLPLLARLFPTAQFIHVIRDGREVAVSLSTQPWWRSTVIAAASFWQRQVRQACRAGGGLPTGRYVEVRLETLVGRPEPVLRELCAFLEEPFAESMLGYHQTAAERVWSGGPGDPRHVDHRHLSSPPTPGLRDWRSGLLATEQEAIEAATQPLLGELGYGTATPTTRAVLAVSADRVRRLPASLAREAVAVARDVAVEVSARRRQRPRP